MSETLTYIKDHGAGPTNWSNYVVYPGVIPPGRIAMSEYPYREFITQQDARLNYSHPSYKAYLAMLKAFPTGVEFICLQEKHELKSPDLPKYYLPSLRSQAQEASKIAHLQFDNSLQIPDVSITVDSDVANYVASLHDDYNLGKNFVIHCMGGHGRTGVVAALLLSYILVDHGIILTGTKILKLIQQCHDQRICRNGWLECPQTDSQRKQVIRLYHRHLKGRNIEAPPEPYSLTKTKPKKLSMGLINQLSSFFRCKSPVDSTPCPPSSSPISYSNWNTDASTDHEDAWLSPTHSPKSNFWTSETTSSVSEITSSVSERLWSEVVNTGFPKVPTPVFNYPRPQPLKILPRLKSQSFELTDLI